MNSGRWTLSLIAAVCLSIAPRETVQAVSPPADPSFSPIVVIDLVPVVSEEFAVATRVFSFTTDDNDPLIVELVGMVHSLNARDSLGGAQRLLSFVRQHGEELSVHSSSRWVSHKGDSVEVILLRPSGQSGAVDFEEKARQSRLTADIDSLMEIAGAIAKKNFVRGPAGVSFALRKYRLRNGRGVLRISAATAPLATDPERNGFVADQPAPLSTTLVTGPPERVFLSANSAYTKIRQVKFNTDAGTFEPGNKPTELLIGVNYSLQDIFQNDAATGAKAFLKGLYFGFLVEPTKRPFNQLAATVGFRHSPPPFESLFSLETVSPYIGVVWARDDVPDPNSETHVKTRYGRPAMIMGLALGLDKAL
ncbi:MAG: hypothetical protein ABIZ36_06575, partial [Gemmatimonadaceae bacterium]